MQPRMTKMFGRAALGAVSFAALTCLHFITLEPLPAQSPKRINRAIELLERGQPIYYTGVSVAKRNYEGGKRLAQTWADYLSYDMEHNPLDVPALAEFMRGLVAGGPTKSGHRMPTVIVTLPMDGDSEMTIKANSWIIKQVLATGVHGLLLCHAQSPGAVRAFVEAVRYPGQPGSNRNGLGEGRRGSGGQGSAAETWGIPVAEYLKRADVWPLNPQGEIMLGLKVENRFALETAEKTTAVPGIAFAEWGPGDMSLSLGVGTHDPPYPPAMAAARARVLAACKANRLAFLNTVREQDVVEMIQEGLMIGSGNEGAARAGRIYTKRKMPW